MVPVLLQSTAQVIQSRLAVERTDDAVLWAFAVAGATILLVHAFSGAEIAAHPTQLSS